MKFNVATVVWLLVGLASLVAAYFQGWVASHPDLLTALAGLYSALGSLLGPLATKAPPSQ